MLEYELVIRGEECFYSDDRCWRHNVLDLIQMSVTGSLGTMYHCISVSSSLEENGEHLFPIVVEVLDDFVYN